ncbi:hypothetical protein [Rhizobium sp. BK176]|uniref:hypothetical protein n=1 Tax=Rhizobium sp. BK176 TaxID=2587071 RepID=UPI002166F4DD|nr:hypothetical protein [Rhizobium sp. BK176]MCS4089643.1 hypothetical protein [Rhizobium sp. BK176]
MALFELAFDVSPGSWDAATLSDAIVEAGFAGAVVETDRVGVLSVQVEHSDPKFERGATVAGEILPFLPDRANLISVRQAAHISELDDEDIEAILSAEYGKQGP